LISMSRYYLATNEFCSLPVCFLLPGGTYRQFDLGKLQYAHMYNLLAVLQLLNAFNPTSCHNVKSCIECCAVPILSLPEFHWDSCHQLYTPVSIDLSVCCFLQIFSLILKMIKRNCSLSTHFRIFFTLLFWL